MSGSFIDSNVLVYLFDDADASKKEIATRVVDQAVDNDEAVISFQVVQEVLNVVLHKIATPIRPERASFLLDSVLTPMWRIMPSAPLYDSALGVHQRYGYRFYDSLIIAAALEAGCDRLLSEDMQHVQTIDGLRIENPFADA